MYDDHCLDRKTEMSDKYKRQAYEWTFGTPEKRQTLRTEAAEEARQIGIKIGKPPLNAGRPPDAPLEPPVDNRGPAVDMQRPLVALPRRRGGRRARSRYFNHPISNEEEPWVQPAANTVSNDLEVNADAIAAQKDEVWIDLT